MLNNNFFRQLVLRAIRTDYLENLTGFAWLLIQPLMLLAVYAFVFTTIFRARIPDTMDIGFVPYLAVAFWPWTAFSEGILKSSNSVSSNAALIGKVAFKSEYLPLSTVTATFLMHMIGYLAVLVILTVTGSPIHWLGVLAAIPVLLFLFVFSAALALLVSCLQVYIRDVSQVVPPLMTFWFFTTPILYSASILPEPWSSLMQLNPMTWFIEHLRAFILLGDFRMGLSDIVVPSVCLLLFWLFLQLFRKLSRHFEDFL